MMSIVELIEPARPKISNPDAMADFAGKLCRQLTVFDFVHASSIACLFAQDGNEYQGIPNEVGNSEKRNQNNIWNSIWAVHSRGTASILTFCIIAKNILSNGTSPVTSTTAIEWHKPSVSPEIQSLAFDERSAKLVHALAPLKLVRSAHLLVF
jgi:hypothetical protein